MNFFQFLQNSNNDTTKGSNKKQKNPKQNIQGTDNKLQGANLGNQEVEVYKNIQRGDIVKIIGVKNSILNSYKGYIGEIKEYKHDKDSAMIFLHPISHQTIIKFPLNHFIKIDPYIVNN